MRLFMRVSILICAAGGTETAMLSSTKKKRGVLVYPHWFKNSMHVQGLIGGADDGAMCERTKHWARPTSKNSTPIFYLGGSWCVLSHFPFDSPLSYNIIQMQASSQSIESQRLGSCES